MLVNPTMSEKKIVTCYREESMKMKSPGNSGEACGEFGDLWNPEHSSLRLRQHVVPALHSPMDTILNEALALTCFLLL